MGLLVDRKRKFGHADVDNDGRIDRKEWIAHFGDDAGFDLCDIVQDGSVSRAELLAYEEFVALDLDNDDRISRKEWIAYFGDDTGFDSHDVNIDGTISQAELLATLTTIRRMK